MWRPYAAVVSLLWLLLLISGAAMCCQVASALLSALSIHSEKLHPAVPTSVHLAEHDGNTCLMFNSHNVFLLFLLTDGHITDKVYHNSIRLKENKLKYVCK